MAELPSDVSEALLQAVERPDAFTSKPVELATHTIPYSNCPGENVLDLFGGSGSTLIACEQMGRRCYMMEIDALYCPVIVHRWEEFTGRKAGRMQVAEDEQAG